MSRTLPRPLLEIKYITAAREYLASLPLEHFMEGEAQARQREITLESFAVLKQLLPLLQYFNELLIQYPTRGGKIRQVVPDNMALLYRKKLKIDGSFDVPLQPVRPLLVLEYVSPGNRRKDYEDSFEKYEKDLKIPYYLLFYPDNQELTLYKHTGKKYVSVKPNGGGRYPIPELELEVAILGGWVRYWFRGELLPLPADLVARLEEAERRAGDAERRAGDAERRAGDAERRAGDAERRAEEIARQAEQERERRLAAERELAELRAQVGRSGQKKPRG